MIQRPIKFTRTLNKYLQNQKPDHKNLVYISFITNLTRNTPLNTKDIY